MNHILTVNYENKPAYDILLQADFSLLQEALETLDMANRRFMIITDSNVEKFYLRELKDIIQKCGKKVETFVFPAGEHSKNLNTVNDCYEKLIEAGFDRNDVLVALGGGVVGDLTGFVAATYLRGIRFVQIPTSLLSMVDSSIGGKTGVDYKLYKNMIGAFHQPKLVYMNLSTLKTLDDKEFYSGMGEIIKHGLIKEEGYYSWLKEHIEDIKAKDYEVLREMIFRSCKIKKAVVEEDPKEKGERALLNFGHTIGHSIEKLMELNLLHGECVCIGMAAAAAISLKRGYIQKIEYEDILNTIESFQQPIKVAGLSPEEIYEVTRYDKKMDNDQIKFILLQKIGNAVIDPSVSKDEMMKAIQSVII